MIKADVNETLPLSVKVQPALEVGKEDDEQEKEADSVADKVMRMPAMSGSTGDKVRKMTDPAEKNVGTMHSGQPVIQKMSAQNQSGINAPASVEKGINSTKGSGQSLAPEVQEEMGSKMEADLGNVKVHTDSNAVQMSRDISAKAFTHGNDIYFNQGQYNPSSNEGKHLLAHELTHTVQQSGKVNKRVQREKKADDSYFPQTVYLPEGYNPKTDCILLYLKKPGIEPKTTGDMDFVTEIKGLGEWSFNIAPGASMAEVYVFTKTAQGVTAQLATEQLLTNTKLVFKLPPKEIVKGDNWKGSAYEKVFNNLASTSSTYTGIISDFKGDNAKYNLKMNYAVAPNQVGPGNTTTKDLYGPNPASNPSLVEGGTVSSNFNPNTDTKLDKAQKTITMNDLGRALTIVHESVHAQLMIDMGYNANFGTTHHDTMSEDSTRSEIVTSLKEFTAANKFSITNFNLELISWYGLLLDRTNVTNFQNWVTNDKISDSLAKESLTLNLDDAKAVQAWIHKINEKIETIIYNTASDPNRYMIK